MAEPAVLEAAANPVGAVVAAGPAPPAENAAPVGGGGGAAAVATVAAVAAVAAVLDSEAQVKQRFDREVESRKAAMRIVARQAAQKAAAAAVFADYRLRSKAIHARAKREAAAATAAHGGQQGPTRAGRVDPEVVVSRRGRVFLDGVLNLTPTLLQGIRDGVCLLFLLASAFLLALSFVHLVEGFNAKPCSRGYVLSPGDSPLLPGECIEGTGGVRRLGFLPGLSWKPRLSVRAGGDTVLSRPDGTEVILTGAEPTEKARVSVLCRAERLARGVAKTGTPVYGARSRLGRLLVGKELFCSADATPTTPSSMSLAKVWHRGGGFLGFSEDGDLEMATASGDVVWAHSEGRKMEEIEQRRKLDKKAFKEKDEEDRSKRLKKLQRDLDQTAQRRESAKAKKGGEEEKPEKPKNKKKGRKRLFGSNNGGAAASGAGIETTSATIQGTPPGQNVVLRVLGWGRSSPKGAGGQSG